MKISKRFEIQTIVNYKQSISSDLRGLIGPGISEGQQKTIFDEGFSTKTGTGRGIGLQLVQKNLIQLDGHLTIGESSLGGARFTAYIPKTIINGESNEHPGPDRG